jgi:hypothetical protein
MCILKKQRISCETETEFLNVILTKSEIRSVEAEGYDEETPRLQRTTMS